MNFYSSKLLINDNDISFVSKNEDSYEYHKLFLLLFCSEIEVLMNECGLKNEEELIFENQLILFDANKKPKTAARLIAKLCELNLRFEGIIQGVKPHTNQECKEENKK